MGGCRCTFRNCGNNTSNSPRLHFFHFPYKDGERCRKWAQYSGNMPFLNLEAAKLRNKVVCEMHFRDENFMNYKKERLIQQAIPTLVRLKDNMVLDYEDGENPKPKFLKPTNLKHLVPPSPCQSFEVEMYSNSTAEKDFQSNEPVYTAPPPKLIKISSSPRILNVAAPQNVSVPGNVGVLKRFEANHSACSRSNSPEFILEALQEPDEIAYESEISQDAIEPEDVEPEPSPEVVLKSVYEEKEQEFLREIENLKMEIAMRDSKVTKLEEELREVRAQNIALQSKPNPPVTQVETITTSRKVDSAPCAPLTKAQLFNGIKKYLTPSMTSMVRMEMFGGPEREWKQDEKNVAVELLSLGEHVYEYICDEWRCRLPSKRDVEQWLTQKGQMADDEDL